ncbi:MAG: right-handed parallel beta-helix repeat-containing protein [Kiritimatiellae bacterium]|nr:right-handed parallel beta-helix repeat-containing protein [Kiritimatiellia bacterium]
MKKCLLLSTVFLSVAVSLAQGKAPPRPKHPKLPLAERIAVIAPARTGELRLTPTFTSIGVAFGSAAEVKDLTLEYRLAGAAEWSRMAYGCAWFADVQNYRGSVWGLAEDADYEVRVCAAGTTLAQGRTRTWKTAVPIARTVEIDPATAAFPLVISEQGTSEGWVRYTVKGGRLEAPRQAPAAVLVTNAAYVVLEDITLRGGDSAGVRIVDSRFVRVRHCDIADWGNDGYLPRYDQKGALFSHWNAKSRRYKGGNHSGGIDILAGAWGVVVERCFIHAPHSWAHSWRYSHPYGPMAIRLSDSAGNHVIRYNDLVGNDLHRFDDTIGGGNDFYEKGTFNRDSDVYGNFVAFANDDCLEIDGGQRNVRVFGNRFEAGFMGVSVQGSLVSPSYVFDNVFTGCEEELGQVASSIKTSGIDLFDYRPAVYLFDNVFWGNGKAIPMYKQTARLKVCNNRCYGPSQTLEGFGETAPYTELSGNVTNLVSEAAPAGNWPRRPIPYVTDRSRIDGVRVTKGQVAPASCEVTLTCGGKDYCQPFEVVDHGDADWLTVTPARGVIASGKTIRLNFAFDAAKMVGRQRFRAAVLIRTADGFSRPVTVYADTDHVQPVHCEQAGETALFAAVDAANPFTTYAFDVPKDGRYYFLLRCRKAPDGEARTVLMAGVDDEALDRYEVREQKDWSWSLVSPGGTYMSWVRYYDLKQGRHTLTLQPQRGTLEMSDLVLTDAPGSFEPDAAKRRK